jgi:hypothetical protein
VGLLFAIPDTRILGIKSYTVLLGFSLSFVVFHLHSICRDFYEFNKPFIFLFFYSLLNLLFFYFYLNTVEENLFIINKNLEILNELLLTFIIFSTSNVLFLKRKYINQFIEIYFVANLIYTLLYVIYPSTVGIFHSEVNIENVDGFVAREAMLGYEPSYTVPLNIIFFLMYKVTHFSKGKLLMFGSITLYSIVSGESKTGLAMLAISFLWLVYSYFKNNYNRSKKYFNIIFLLILISGLYRFNDYVQNDLMLSDFANLEKIDQYKLISWKTRTEMIYNSLSFIIDNPLGVGHGNSIVHISRKVTSGASNIQSFEIEESNWTARSPKSQLIEYVAGGGIIFFILLVCQQKKLIVKMNQLKSASDKAQLGMIFVLILITFLIGERIPYILLSYLLYEIACTGEQSV